MECTFNDCKLIGLNFEFCENLNTASIVLNASLIIHLCMHSAKLSRCNFSQCIFRKPIFTLCDVRAAIFDQCDFAGAHFERTNLEKADLTTSHHFLINPESE